ncbi:hypothetical protein FNV43_RR26486 [Rhamnella rubrinervis]|uniref:non-specific serine/threonine protein kinase n=1 Tax=Rhamnella rubrinervis TaxID=2594499 RepID=A0A8K0DIV9_9ROSA|nr:hypothetical protein FNV43_RR26486 [Rhamnella rubrinervis]
MASVSILFMLILTHLLLLNSAEEQRYNLSCEPFVCGKLGEIRFPYKEKSQHGNCGLYNIDCSEPSYTKIQLKEGGYWYNIVYISQTGLIFINDTKLHTQVESRRCESLESFGLPSPSKIATVSTQNTVSLFKCNLRLLDENIGLPRDFYNTTCGDYSIYYHITTTTNRLLDNSSFQGLPHYQCSFIQLPGSYYTGKSINNFFSLFTDKFHLQVHVNYVCIQCHKQGHQCLFHDEQQSYYCAPSGSASAGSILVVIFCCLMRKSLAYKFIYLWKKPNQAHQNVEAFLRKLGPLPVRRYSYSEVKKMTNCFTNKIAQGGQGRVFKGKLQNSQLVAVKVLNQSKDNGEEFINEVATIGRTSHVNVVSLLGFCFEGPKRALIYEFMPNGSLEKFILKENGNQNDNHQLEWGTLYQISLGIARGLEYLHRGCNTRILHFDIKPHNILLDKDFAPKISDFGLAKVCTREESIISMLGPRGTIGYIAPEVIFRSVGGVSHKSDVYSYGMMVLEMVGGRKNDNVGVDNSSEIYFPHWIYKRIELDEELRLKRITNVDEKTEVRKMIMVSLWCIQTDPSNRPTMSRVIEMLEGSLDSLEVPPKPYLSSHSRSLSTESSSGFTSLQIISTY